MKRKISILLALSMIMATFSFGGVANAEETGFADITTVSMPENMMQNPTNGNVFGNVNVEDGSITKSYNQNSNWNNAYNAFEGYFIEAVNDTVANKAWYSKLAGVVTTGGANGAGGLVGKELTPEKAYVLSFLARNAGNTDSAVVNFGLGNVTTWASCVYPVENGEAGYSVESKTEWTKVAGTLVAPSANPYLSIGFPQGTPAGTKIEMNLFYQPEEAIYFAEEVAYSIDVESDKDSIDQGDSFNVTAEVFNQVGTKGTLSQDFDWYVVNADRTEEAEGFTVTKNANGAKITAVDAPAGNYVVLAKSAEGLQKGIEFTVIEKFTNFVDITTTAKPENMMQNPTNGNVFGNVNVSDGSITKNYNQGSNWNNTYNAYEGYFIDAVNDTVANAPYYSKLAGIVTTGGANGAGGLVGKELTPEKAYVLSFLARNAGNTDSAVVNFGLGNVTTWASCVYPVENGEAGYSVESKTEWTKVAGTLVAPSANPYLSIGFPQGTPAGTKIEMNLCYLPEDAIYFAEEVAYSIDVEADKDSIDQGDSFNVTAEVFNQVGTKGTLSQDFDWYVVNADRTEEAEGFTVTKNANGAKITAVDAPAGNYVVFAKSAEGLQKGIEFTVIEKFTNFVDITTAAKPENMMQNPTNGNVFGNVNVSDGSITKSYNQSSNWNNAYNAFEGYFIDAVNDTVANAPYYSKLAGVVTTGGEGSGAGGLAGKTLTPEKAYVLSFLARNAGNADSAVVNFGLGNVNTWASCVYPVENGEAGYSVESKTEWTKVAGTLVAPSATPYLSIGFPQGTPGGTKIEMNLFYQPEEALYFAEEVAYSINVESDKDSVDQGDSFNVTAEVFNQVGTKGTLSQDFDWYVVNADRTEEAEGFTVTKNANGAKITAVDAPAGNYVVFAKSAEGLQKGIEFTVNEAAQSPVISVTKVDMGSYQGSAWDVAICNFDSAMTYMAKFVSGNEEKTGEIGFENVETEGGSVAFAVFLRTSRANVSFDVVAE